MYYAQIDPVTRVCFAQTETHSVIHDPCMIEVESLGEGLLGCTYANGAFIPPLPTQPTRRDVITARLQEIDFTTDKPRTRRELQLSKTATKNWLQTLDNEAEALRTELAGL